MSLLSASPEPTRVLLWLGVLGFLIRLVYFTEHAGSAFFDVPILDEKYYASLGSDLAAGRSIAEINPGFRPLLYPFYLAFFFHLFGAAAAIPAIACQHLLGIATALIVAHLAMRLYRRAAAGVWAGLFYLLAGPPLFFEGELLIASFFTFLFAVQLLLATSLDDRPSRWCGAGAWTALAAQARPNALVVLAAWPLEAVLARRGRRTVSPRGDQRGGKTVSPWGDSRGGKTVFLSGLALVAAAVMLYGFALVQERFTGHQQWLGGSGGVNVYLGNKRGADGMVPRQDRAVTYGAEYRDSVQVFAEEIYRETTGDESPRVAPSRVSSFWLERTLGEVRADPGAWLVLMAKKGLFLVWNREIPNNKTFSFIRRHESAVLGYLPVCWGFLFALAPVGILHAWRGDPRQRRTLRRLALVTVLFAGGIVLVFVNSRYRLPLWTVAAVLAGGGMTALLDAGRERRFRELGVALAVALLAAALSFPNWLGLPPPSHARDFFFRSIAQLEKGRLEEAESDARRSVELDPNDAAAVFQLGSVVLTRGDARAALTHFEHAVTLRPDEPRIWNNIGVSLERLDRPVDAYRVYRRALDLAGDYPPALVNAALLELRSGLTTDAAARVRRAGELGFESVSFYCALAFVERDRGREAGFRRALEAARELDANAAALLLEENSLRLDAEALSPSGEQGGKTLSLPPLDPPKGTLKP